MKRHIDVWLWTGILVAFFSTRLINLGIIPIFTDEAIYLRWSQIMAYDAGLRYLPLIDGKPPLFMWLTSIIMRSLPNIDPLLTGRLVSVGAGLGSLIGIYFAAWQIFKNKKIAYLSSIFYLLSPFAFFYDRFGLADSLLATLGIWTLAFSVFLVRTVRLDAAMILGLIIGFGLLTKTPAMFFYLLLPLSAFLGRLRLRLVPLFLVVIIFSQGVYSILRLFPLFNMINQKNHEFILTLAQFLANPWQNLWGNLRSLASWEVSYLTVPVTVLIFVALKKYFRPGLILISIFIIHIVYMSIFNKVIYPRFLLTFTPYILILAGAGLSFFNKYKLILISALVFVLPAFTIYMLTTDPINAPLLQADRDQYLDGWPAGFGVKEVRIYLSMQSGRRTVATEGTFGLMPYALELYQRDYPNIEIKSYWPLPSKQPAGTNYLLMYQDQKEPSSGWKLEELMRFRQGLGRDYLRLYKVFP